MFWKTKIRSHLPAVLCETILPRSTASTTQSFWYWKEQKVEHLPDKSGENLLRFQTVVILLLGLASGYFLLKCRDLLFRQDAGSEHPCNMRQHDIDTEDDDLDLLDDKELWEATKPASDRSFTNSILKKRSRHQFVSNNVADHGMNTDDDYVMVSGASAKVK